MMRKIVVHNHFPSRDVSPEQIKGALAEARLRYQNLFHARKKAEADARALKGDPKAQEAAWSFAQRLSEEQSKALSNYNTMVDAGTRAGVRGLSKIRPGEVRDVMSSVPEGGNSWRVKLSKSGEVKRVVVAAPDARAAVAAAEKENPGWVGSFQHTVRASRDAALQAHRISGGWVVERDDGKRCVIEKDCTERQAIEEAKLSGKWR